MIGPDGYFGELGPMLNPAPQRVRPRPRSHRADRLSVQHFRSLRPGQRRPEATQP